MFRGAPDDEGIFTKGDSFRARAEAHQRTYRASVLNAAPGKYGHLLDAKATREGKNFISEEVAAMAACRAAAGKGVALDRTAGNMLSSQAMCFNLFGPLSTPGGRVLAARTLRRFLPDVAEVLRIIIEHTPDADVFGDQTGRGGVDCDVLVEYRLAAGARALLSIETKFVEPDFSNCGFRAEWRKKATPEREASFCPTEIVLGKGGAACRYSKKGYLYWQRALELDAVRAALAAECGCPFGGPGWQLWVNHVLVHVEAQRRGATRATFAVVAPRDNQALLRNGAVFETFRATLTDPSTFVSIPLEDLIAGLVSDSSGDPWAEMLARRYVVPAACFPEGSPRRSPS